MDDAGWHDGIMLIVLHDGSVQTILTRPWAWLTVQGVKYGRHIHQSRPSPYPFFFLIEEPRTWLTTPEDTASSTSTMERVSPFSFTDKLNFPHSTLWFGTDEVKSTQGTGPQKERRQC